MTDVPLSEASDLVSDLVDQATQGVDVRLTEDGEAVAVMVGAEKYESMQATLAVLADWRFFQSVLEADGEPGLIPIEDVAERFEARRRAAQDPTVELPKDEPPSGNPFALPRSQAASAAAARAFAARHVLTTPGQIDAPPEDYGSGQDVAPAARIAAVVDPAPAPMPDALAAFAAQAARPVVDLLLWADDPTRRTSWSWLGYLTRLLPPRPPGFDRGILDHPIFGLRTDIMSSLAACYNFPVNLGVLAEDTLAGLPTAVTEPWDIPRQRGQGGRGNGGGSVAYDEHGRAWILRKPSSGDEQIIAHAVDDPTEVRVARLARPSTRHRKNWRASRNNRRGLFLPDSVADAPTREQKTSSE